MSAADRITEGLRLAAVELDCSGPRNVDAALAELRREVYDLAQLIEATRRKL